LEKITAVIVSEEDERKKQAKTEQKNKFKGDKKTWNK